MDIDNKAQEYATEKVEFIKDAIVEAYKQGYADGAESIKPKAPIVVDGIEYVDLGLPSGRLWSSDYLINENGFIDKKIYNEAIKYNIPTVKDSEELNDCCSIITKSDQIIICGINGKSIRLRRNKCFENDFTYLTWTSDNHSSTDAQALWYYKDFSRYQCRETFKGFHLPIMLVK